MKKLLRTKSRRVPLKLRATIRKKAKESRKKLKREMRKNPEKFRKLNRNKLYKVPNDCPFKEKVLIEEEQQRRQKELEKQQRKEQNRAERKAAKEAEFNASKGLEDLVKSAESRDTVFEAKSGSVLPKSQDKGELADNSAKAYYKEFRKVVEAADVILEILDARDPLGTRSSVVEKAVVESGPNKRLVLVLNKADLIPKENLQLWLKYLRNEFPTIAFKASTQSQANRLGRNNKKITWVTDSELQSSKCLGADTLMKLLGNYCQNRGIRTQIRVGVVGLPNVGKSSIINSLKRSKACLVGATPGITKSMQEVALDSKIILLDSPGMVLAAGNMSDSSVALRNAIKVESLTDPITPVEAILRRTNKEYMMLQYILEDYDTTKDFLCLLAKRIGKLKKGGIPDYEAAARRVLQDWNTGRLKYYTHPPELMSHVSAEVVQTMAREFSLDDSEFNAMETEDLEALPQVRPSQTVRVESNGIVDNVKEGDTDEELDDDDDDSDDISD
ncbi:guanine nucleotide-binding protein-like 3 homolog isoform X2 [Artemia franciscana]|uniref:guanine nucleotide-binding protein-like 3 homolog isoform X2 n=1 Tax=Artemia franciscana TaxID=6661 RepID=UPI0032DBED0A